MESTSDDNSEYLSDNNGADDKSRRRDSFGGIKNDLGQVLPGPRPKYDDPAVAAAVLASQRSHRGAVFFPRDRQAARDARAAATATITGADWSEWFAEGEKTLFWMQCHMNNAVQKPKRTRKNNLSVRLLCPCRFVTPRPVTVTS